MVFVPHKHLYFAANFLLGISTPPKAMIAFTHMMEWVPGKEGLVGGLFFAWDGFVMIASPLALVYLTKNTQLFLWLALAINVAALVLFCMVYFPESPIYLLDQGKCDELLLVLRNLYNWNKTPEEHQVKLNNLVERYKTQKLMHEALVKAGKVQ